MDFLTEFSTQHLRAHWLPLLGVTLGTILLILSAATYLVIRIMAPQKVPPAHLKQPRQHFSRPLRLRVQKRRLELARERNRRKKKVSEDTHDSLSHHLL